MKLLPSQTNTSSTTKQHAVSEGGGSPSAWYRNWECYLVVLVAGFLRFYGVDRSQFEGDQVLIFRMAYDAVHHGLLLVTNSTASLGFANPPGLLYFYLLPAALSSDPILAILLSSLFSVIAVLLTYLFVTRYYGRFAGVVAGLLYAAAPIPLVYSRFIWQPNMMQPFVVLFFLALFRGVVDRRRGWLPLAILWLAMLFQTHTTVLLLVVPLLMALLFAPETLRWRDLGNSCVVLAVVFFPYLLWELITNFSDIAIIRSILHAQACFRANACIDNTSWNLYLTFLGSHDPQLHLTSSSLVNTLSLPLSWLATILLFCVIGGFITALILSLHRWRQSVRAAHGVKKVSDGHAPEMGTSGTMKMRRGTRQGYPYNVPPPTAAGLLLLCVWQLLPPLVMARHTLPLYTHYLLVTIPGPFILAAIFLEKLREWLRSFSTQGAIHCTPTHSLFWLIAHGLLYSTTIVLLLMQIVGGTALVLDEVQGHFIDTSHKAYFTDPHSLQDAYSELDHLAQQRHISRVYVATDLSNRQAMYFYSRQLHTPVTVFDDEQCLVLPNAADGPALLLTPPYADFTYALLNNYASAQLVEQPPLPGGDPFRIYELSTSVKQMPPQAAFGQDLQLESLQTQRFSLDSTTRVIGLWNWLHSQAPAYETTYHYQVKMLRSAQHDRAGGGNAQAIATTCTFNAMRAGDHLLAAFDLPEGNVVPRTAALSVQYSISTQDMPSFGPLHLITHRHLNSPYITLQTTDGKNSIIVPVT